jgi:hypothetical protein
MSHGIHDIKETCLLIPFITIYAIHVPVSMCIICRRYGLGV